MTRPRNNQHLANCAPALKSDAARRPAIVRQRHSASDVLLICFLMSLVAMAGCHRSLYRQEADAQANCLIRQKANDPRWPLEQFSVYPDVASRMFDPFDPDCPPIPPDDPAAHEFMHCVYCMEGSPCWHHRGDAQSVENSEWCSLLPWSEEGKVKIDPNSAMRLALLHSPEYQQEVEDLYLSALDVSFQRFRFDTQFFGGYSGFLTLDGRNRSGVGNSATTFDLSTSNWRAQKLFASGAELAVGFANSLVWQFSGPDTHSATTLIDFTLLQPLLRGAGREIVLEQLTQTERDLLANVRQMERFRRGFYLNVFVGRNAGAGPARGGVGIPQTGFANSNPNGLLGLLQTQQTIRNQRANLAALESSVAQLESFYLAGRIDYFQVELARQAFYNAQSRLLTAELSYANALDQFKIQLGLPPSLEIEIDDELIEPFQLVDPAAVDLQNRLTLLQRGVGKTIVQLLDAFRPEKESTPAEVEEDVEDQENDEDESDTVDREEAPSKTGPNPSQEGNTGSDEAESEWGEPSPGAVGGLLQRLAQQVETALDVIDKATGDDMDVVANDIEKLSESRSDRQASIEQLKRQLSSQKHEWHVDKMATEVSSEDAEDMLPFDEERLEKLPEQLERTLADVKLVFGQLKKAFEEVKQAIADAEGETVNDDLFEQIRDKVFTRLPDELNNLAANVLSLTLVQARARTESVTLVPVEVTWPRAYSAAREYRLDWMNARASLVDTWRQIEITADQLETQLDLVISGDISNSGDNPLRIRDNTGRLRFGVEIDAPLSRLGERNTYREALIEYQRARRQFYRFRDAISSNLRATIRTLDINQLNFEFRRAAVEVAIAQVELARLRLREPPRPNEQSRLGATTARDLVSALSDLLSVQNDFLSVWISHESLRRSLDFDMGTMELNQDGVWIDPGKVTDESLPVSGQGSSWEHCEQVESPFGQSSQPYADSTAMGETSVEEEPYDAGIYAKGVHRLPTPNTEGDLGAPQVFADEFIEVLPTPEE
jgi:outer membrane protein TolC